MANVIFIISRWTGKGNSASGFGMIGNLNSPVKCNLPVGRLDGFNHPRRNTL
jgi:hypothetical protein